MIMLSPSKFIKLHRAITFMRIIFLGVGEAFDENHPNTSIFIEDIGLLLDCGFSSLQPLWSSGMHKSIKAICLSHFHADHAFGLPPLFMRYLEEKRKDPLKIIGAVGVEKHVRSLAELAYPGYTGKLPFILSFEEIGSDSKLQINDAVLSFTKASHVESSYAVRIDLRKKSVVYSGDSGYSEKIVDLAKGADLLIHEAYTCELERKEKGWKHHSSFLSASMCASRSGSKALAIVHVLRSRRDRKDIEKEAGNEYKGRIIIPDGLDRIEI